MTELARSPSGVAVRALLFALVAVLLAGCTAEPAPAPAAVPPDSALPRTLVAAVSGDGAYRHLQELQRIADVHGGNRALGTPGYDASVEYVARVLREAGYRVQTPTFGLRQFVPGEIRLAVGDARVPATVLEFSPSGTVHAPLAAVAQDTTSGCEATDFAGVPAGTVVLVRRGTCPFAQKSSTAAAAGAAAVIIVDAMDAAEGVATLGADATGTVPTVMVARALGDTLVGRVGSMVDLSVAATVEDVTSRNVIAQTDTGNTAAVVMAGAHLDSVRAGPGINDNGSGVAALLETAVRLGAMPRVANAVRFGFWGGEEAGLVGSTQYVTGLPEGRRRQIAAYLNLDMVASPNAGYLVDDGDDSDRVGAGPGPGGSGAIERLIIDGLAAAGVTTQGTDFTGRSDYAPFIAAGIPSGGIFTGAEDSKTPAQAGVWGGRAEAAFDPCYHQACDRLDNIDRTALDRNVDAAAATIAQLALSTEALGRR